MKKYITTASLFVSFLLPVAAAQALAVAAQGNAYTNGVVNVDTSVSGDANTQTNVDTSVAPIVVTQTTVDATTAGATDAVVVNPTSVQSKAQLSAYASSLIKTDADASDAALSSSAVTLSYKEPAKLFGVIQIYVKATATVNADGQTSVSYPWFTFFGTTDSDSLKAGIETATATTVAANGTANAGLSNSAQAQILAQMHEVMKSDLQGSISANASASTQ